MQRTNNLYSTERNSGVDRFDKTSFQKQYSVKYTDFFKLYGRKPHGLGYVPMLFSRLGSRLLVTRILATF